MCFRSTLTLVFGVLALAVAAQGVEPDSITVRTGFFYTHQAGIRLGAWANLGDTPPAISQDTATYFETNFHDASFYFEAYYAHRLTRALMGEFSVGIVNRGSVTFRVQDRDNVGNLIVYSVLLQAKVYPFASTGWTIQPYLTGGGGLYYGRRSVQISSSIDYYYYPGLDEESATDFNYAVGGGFDLPVASQIGLDFNIKYLPIEFGDPLMTVKDYSALAITVGVKYLYAGSSKDSDRNRRK